MISRKTLTAPVHAMVIGISHLTSDSGLVGCSTHTRHLESTCPTGQFWKPLRFRLVCKPVGHHARKVEAMKTTKNEDGTFKIQSDGSDIENAAVSSIIEAMFTLAEAGEVEDEIANNHGCTGGKANWVTVPCAAWAARSVPPSR